METVNFAKILRSTDSSETTVAFAQKLGLLPKTARCPNCDKELSKVMFEGSYCFFRCTCKKRTRVSITKNTILYDHKISVQQFIIVGYGWCEGWKYRQIRKEVDLSDEPGSGPKLSDATISRYFKFFRYF